MLDERMSVRVANDVKRLMEWAREDKCVYGVAHYSLCHVVFPLDRSGRGLHRFSRQFNLFLTVCWIL